MASYPPFFFSKYFTQNNKMIIQLEVVLMNICFVNPLINAKDYTEPSSHLGISYIAATLERAGFAVDVIDAPVNKLSHREICEQIQKNRYSVIGISCYYYNYRSASRIMKYIRTNFPQTFLFLGGYLPTLAYEKMRYDFNFVDCMVIGEGEITTLKLMENLKNGDWKTTPGIVFLNGDEIKYTGKADLVDDLDQLPFPLRDKSKAKQESMDISASRGCYGHCNFCGIKEFYGTCNGQIIRRRSPENVVDEIKSLLNEFKPKNIVFVDDNFCINSQSAKEWFYKFRELLMVENIHVKFQCNFRANEIVNNEKIIKDFIDIGLNHVFVGVESFLEKHLMFYNKMVTVDENIKALQILDKLKVNYDIGFLLYNPITTIEDIIETINVIEKMHFNEENKFLIRSFSAAIVNSIYGTPLDNYVIENGLYANVPNGYLIKDSKARLCYEVAKVWKEKTDHLFRKNSLYYIAENNDDHNHMKICKKIFFELFYYDLNVLKKITQQIEGGKTSVEEFIVDITDWYSRLNKIEQGLEDLEQELNQFITDR